MTKKEIIAFLKENKEKLQNSFNVKKIGLLALMQKIMQPKTAILILL